MPSLTAHSTRPRGEVTAGLLTELTVRAAETTTAAQPVTVGVPFPKGALRDTDAVGLDDPQGRPVLLQAEPLARWSDGSVKWLLLDFVCPPGVDDGSRWALRRNAEGAADAGLVIKETAEAVAVDTGEAVFILDRTAVPPLFRVLRDGREVIAGGSFRTLLTDKGGRLGAPRVERFAVEARGPVRATVRLEGVFRGRVPCRFVARCCFFAGTGLVRVRLTVHNPNRARHAGGLWDLGDPGSMLFRDLTLELKTVTQSRVTWTAEPGQPPRRLDGAELEIFQASSGGENWNGRNHVNRHGRVPCPFRGYRVRTPDGGECGLRASPVVSLESAGLSVTAAAPEFWQQFPKAVEVSGSALRVRLFPGQFGDLFELQGGEQKTHAVWLHFGEAGGSAPLGWAHRPVTASAAPEWYANSGAVPFLLPASEARDGRLDEYLRPAVEGPKSFFAGREVIDEYGWRNFGEVYANHEGTYYDGPKPVVSHYNNQYDVVYGALLQFYRTGDARWLDVSDPLARHIADVDVYHTDRDKAAYNGGLFWFTDHYKDAATSTHRTYSRANRPAGKPYGGGPGSCHNFTTGLLHHYYLTGDRNSLAAVLSLADWVVAMDDGRRNVLGLVDNGPTGFASSSFDENYHGPGRGPGLSINALIDSWLATGCRGHLDKAEELIRRAVHPADDVAARDLLDVEKYWSYTVFFSALARYLDVKAEAGELDAAYAYARASLLRYAAWMAEHERPYFDQAERLEYPTEAWAAQEFRKANVLRLAAAYADEPLRSRLLRRGEELADRAWQDLARFDTRHAARAVAILMVEGVVDAFYRAGAGPLRPRPSSAFDFGRPEPFVPQKRRVVAKLKSARGLLAAALRLADVRRWLRLVRP